MAHFLRIRFPILLALNKIDRPKAAGYAQEAIAAFPYDTFVPLSAKLEFELQSWEAKVGDVSTFYAGLDEAVLGTQSVQWQWSWRHHVAAISCRTVDEHEMGRRPAGLPCSLSIGADLCRPPPLNTAMPKKPQKNNTPQSG